MSLEFWSKGGIVNLKTDNPQLRQFFEIGFRSRDERLGQDYQRFSDNTFHFSLWELAEAYFTHYSSKEFASILRKHTTTPENQPEALILKYIQDFDKWVYPAFVIENERFSENGSKKSLRIGETPFKYNFWQIYCEGLSSEELKKAIPSRYFSRTKAQGVWLPEHSSPLLIDRQKAQALEQLTGDKRTGETITQHAMKHNLDELTIQDLIQGRLYRRWHHPIMIHNRTRGFRATTATTQDGLMENLALFYPRFRTLRYTMLGEPVDLIPSFLRE